MKLKQWIKNYNYTFIILYLPFFLFFFWLLEQYHASEYIMIHCILDDYIPFQEIFIIPYLIWFPFILGGIALLVFLSFHNKEAKFSFLHVSWMIAIGFTICLLIYFIFPNALELRPNPYPRQNIFTNLCALIQGIDTPSNVCPSMHVFSSTALFLVIFNSPYFKEKTGWRRIIRLCTLPCMLFINISTLFVKQHSVVDVFWALVLSVVLYFGVKIVLKKRYDH